MMEEHKEGCCCHEHEESCNCGHVHNHEDENCDCGHEHKHENCECGCNHNHEEKNDCVEQEEQPIDMKASYKRKLAKKDEEIDKLKKDVEHWKNEYYRVYADMANLRKDIQKDHSEAIKYRLEGFVSDLVSVLASFEMAFKHDPKSEETKNFLMGFKFVQSNLLNILSNEGIQIIEPKINDKFDEKTMQAVEKVQDDGEENLIKEVILKGYKLHDHLVRPAMVKVSAHEVENKKDDNGESHQDK